MTAPRWRGLVGVLAALSVASIGTRLSAVALPWFVLTTTGSAARTGVVVFAELAPYVLSKVLSGPVLDRVGPRRISIAGDLASTAAVGLVPLLYAAGTLSFGLLLPLVALFGAFRGPADAAKGVFIPDVAEAARVPLERGIGLASTIERLASMVGPAAGGVLVAAGGPYALIVTAVLCGTGAVLIGCSTPACRRQADAKSGETYLNRLRGGAAFLRRERLLRSIAGMVAVANLLDGAWTAVLLPVWVRASGHGPELVGLLLSVLFGCSAAASLLAAVIAHRLPRRTVFLVGFLFAGAPRFVTLALGAPLWVTLAVFAVSGFGSGFVNPIIGAVEFERVPRQLYGRVQTLMAAIAWSGMPFGGVVGGALVAIAGPGPALVAFGAVYLVATTLPGLRKEWGEMDRDRRRFAGERTADPPVRR